jgi:large repetitive protein
VPILTDTVPEPDETVRVQITNPVGGVLGTAIADGIIVDDDGPPSVSVTSGFITEGCDGTSSLVFNVVLNRPAATPVSVNFTTADGTAQAGSDYRSTSGSVTFNPGQTTQPISVQVIGDSLVEPDETFQVNLTSATGATIAVPSGTGTIFNDD